MRQQLSPRRLVVADRLLERALPRYKRLDDVMIVEDPRENVCLEIFDTHLANGRQHFVERDLPRDALDGVGEQRPENRQRGDALCDALKVARQAAQRLFFPWLEWRRSVARQHV